MKLLGCRNIGHVDGQYYSQALQYSSNLCSFCNSLIKLPDCKVHRHVDGCVMNSGSAIWGSSQFDSRIFVDKVSISVNEKVAEKTPGKESPKSIGREVETELSPRTKGKYKGGDSNLKQRLNSTASHTTTVSCTTQNELFAVQSTQHSRKQEGSALRSPLLAVDKEEEQEYQTAPDLFLTSVSGYVPSEVSGGILRKTNSTSVGKTKKSVQWADCATGGASAKLSTHFVYNNSFSP